MISYDKQEIRNLLTDEQIFSLLYEFGGNPTYTTDGIISDTICHNPPGVGSHKLYYYSNTKLFRCYSGCEDPLFDIFQLTIKTKLIQEKVEIDLNEAVRWVAYHFGFSGIEVLDKDKNLLEDWERIDDWARIKDIEIKNNNIILEEYDSSILDRLNYNVKIEPWIKEGITPEVIEKAK